MIRFPDTSQRETREFVLQTRLCLPRGLTRGVHNVVRSGFQHVPRTNFLASLRGSYGDERIGCGNPFVSHDRFTGLRLHGADTGNMPKGKPGKMCVYCFRACRYAHTRRKAQLSAARGLKESAIKALWATTHA